MAFPIVTAQEQIGQLYVGYFGRAADPDGLNYWVNQLNGGMSLTAIANSFAVQPEATALYSFLAAPAVGDPAAFITAIYQDLFNRGPDAAGLAYWVNQLTVQHTPPGQMVLNIISGAQGADKTAVENKTHVAVDYAQKFVNNNLTWIAIDNTQGAHDVVTPVTSDPATVVTAIQQIDAIISQELTNPQNISLTPNLATIQSGGTVAVTLHADPSQAGKDFQYTITGVQSSEIKGGALSGTVKLGSDSTAVINIGTVVNAANLNTPNETIKVTVGPISTNVGLTEGTQTVTQTGPVNEGQSFNFDVITAGIASGAANGLTQTYTISGPGLAHIPVAERSGTIVLDQNGHAVVTVHTLATLPDSGDTKVTITVGNDTPVDVTIHETAVQHVDPSVGTIQEGATVVFTVTTTGVAGSAVAGQVENWVLSGAGAAQVDGPLSGSFALDQNGTATITVHTTANVLNGLSPQDLVITILSGAVPTATNTVHINEGTQVTTNTGPVNEGSAFSFSVATSGVPAGSVAGRVENYTITGPGLDHIPVAERSGQVTLDANGNATVTVHTLADLANPGGTTTVSIAVGNNVASTVTINETAQQSVATSAPSILEGGSVVFTINTVGVLGSAVAGQTETWTLSGLAASQVNGPLSGTVTLDSNGSATVTVNTNVDALNDGILKNLIFTLKSGSQTTATAGVDVLQGTQVTTAPASVTEGSAFTFEVTTSGVAQGSVAGRVETYTITGAGVSHIPAAERTGQVTLDANGHASVSVHTLVDLGQLGPDPVIITVGNNAPITVNVQDTAIQTVTVVPVSADIIQGASLTFTIHTDGVPAGSLAGTTQTWTLTGTGTNQVTGGILSGTVTLDANNSAVVTVGTDFKIINMNGQFGSPGTQNLVFHLNSGGTDVTSPTVTIHESTLSVTAPVAPIVEGNQVTYTIAGVNIPSGTTYHYTLSGAAIGNVAAASVHGTVTVNNNAAVVVVNTLGGDLSGVNKGLTLTIDEVPTATGTAQISETAPASIILTTNTDTPGAVPPAANTLGNAAGNNSYFAVANSSLFGLTSTLGQNDVLDGNSNVVGKPNTLFLNTTGAFAQLINAFSSTNIQIFNINAGQAAGGTTVDMSSVFGMTNLLNVNSSGKLTLLNVTAATDVEITNPSDIFPGVTVDTALQYQNNPAKPATQNLKLDPTVSPITGLANSRFWVNVDKVTITSTGPGTNGLLTVNGATNGFGPTALTTLTLLGATNFLSGSAGSGQVATTFTNTGFASGSNLLDLSNFGGVYFNIGDPGSFEAITSVGGLTIESGAGGILGAYTPGPGFTGATQLGGAVTVIGGDFALNLRSGNVWDPLESTCRHASLSIL